MAISKRLRYEVLRRDSHTCRYCGRSAPDVALTVDHVVPVALGGSDDPTNLVTACRDCNSGKSASAPDASLVANVADDAIRWAAAIRQAADTMLGDLFERQADRRTFKTAWEAWKFGTKNMRLPLPDNWERSIDNFIAAGLPIEVLTDDIRKAMTAPKVEPEHTFRYMCGIAWNQVAEIQEHARGSLSGSSARTSGPSAVEFVNTLWGYLPVDVTTDHIQEWADYFREDMASRDPDEEEVLDLTSWPTELCAFTYVLRDITSEELAWQFASRLLRTVPYTPRRQWIEEAEEMARKVGDETGSKQTLETAAWTAFEHYRRLAGDVTEDEPPFAPQTEG